jgi:hypothetical protein
MSVIRGASWTGSVGGAALLVIGMANPLAVAGFMIAGALVGLLRRE